WHRVSVRASASRLFFFSSRRRHTRLVSDWSSDVCSSDLVGPNGGPDSVAPVPPALPVLPLKDAVTFPDTLTPLAVAQPRSVQLRSEERRVGKECRSRGSRGH